MRVDNLIASANGTTSGNTNYDFISGSWNPDEVSAGQIFFTTVGTTARST